MYFSILPDHLYIGHKEARYCKKKKKLKRNSDKQKQALELLESVSKLTRRVQ